MWWFLFALILVVGGGIIFGARSFYSWIVYGWADRQFLFARRDTNFTYLVADGENVCRVEVNPIDKQWQAFYTEAAKHRETYRVSTGRPGLVWVGFPPNRFRLKSWAPTKYYEFVRGGSRHAVPMQIQRLEYPFQPDDATLKALNEKADKARAVFTALERNVPTDQAPIYLTPDEADLLSYMPSMRSKDNIETNIWVTLYVQIIFADDMVAKAKNYQDELEGVVDPAMRLVAADLELMSITSTKTVANATTAPDTIVKFERGKLLSEGQAALRKELGVDVTKQIVTYADYIAICGEQTIRGQVLRDWGIFIANAVIKDAQEVSGELEKAAETFVKKQAEQAGRLVEARTTRDLKILEAEGESQAKERVAKADAFRITTIADADQKAAVARITGFSIGERPDEAGRAAFLLWFEKETMRQGLTTSGRTTYVLPQQFSAFAPLLEELRMAMTKPSGDSKSKTEAAEGDQSTAAS